MIRHARLLALIAQNVRRNRKHFILSAFGIVVGIATFSFFLALGLGVRHIVLGEIFPIDRLEVVPSRTNFGAGGSFLLGGSARLDDTFVARLRAQPGVAGIFPKMKLGFPARGWGGHELLGRNHDLFFEVSGFVDGIEPSLVDDGGLKPDLPFEDWEADPATKHAACYRDTDCEAPLYCAWDVHQCRHPVPVLVSKYLLELYNGSIAPSHSLPKIGSFLASRFLGFTFTIELGVSYLGDRASKGPVGIQRKLQLVGISDRAIPLGLTLPLGYVRRWNEAFEGPSAAREYSSVIARVRDKSDLTALSTWIKKQGFDVADSAAQEVGLFITIVMLLLTFISVVIVAVAAINIAHTFFMLITERRREIGVLRAVGASRSDIRRILLGEATLIGLTGGLVGLGVAFGASWLVDFLSRTVLPDFPFKPTSYFRFSPALCGAAILFAVAFCLLGAIVPAQRAASVEPAAALSAN